MSIGNQARTERRRFSIWSFRKKPFTGRFAFACGLALEAVGFAKPVIVVSNDLDE